MKIMTMSERRELGIDPEALKKMTFVALDPGLDNPAYAIYINGVLTIAERVKIPSAWTAFEIGQRAQRIAALAGAVVQTGLIDHQVKSLRAVVYELPQIYRGPKSNARPEDILKLAIMAGAFAANFPFADVLSPTPRQWSLGTKKLTKGDPWKSLRGRRLQNCLTIEEISRIERTHDALDAAAIGAWALERFAAPGVFPGAT